MDVMETQPEPTDPELIPRAWWRSDDAGTKYRGLEETLLYLRDYLVKEKFDVRSRLLRSCAYLNLSAGRLWLQSRGDNGSVDIRLGKHRAFIGR